MRLALLALAGCFSATIHIAPQPGVPTMPVLSDAWHVSILGVFELSDPVSLGVCPITDIEENQSLAAALIGGLFGVDIMDTTLSCPMGPPQMAPVPWSGPPGADQ